MTPTRHVPKTGSAPARGDRVQTLPKEIKDLVAQREQEIRTALRKLRGTVDKSVSIPGSGKPNGRPIVIERVKPT